MTKTKPIRGKCFACGAEPKTRVLYKGKSRIGCNRCASRHRQGGNFLESLHDRREKLAPVAVKMNRAGKTPLEIARKLGVSTPTVKRWMESV